MSKYAVPLAILASAVVLIWDWYLEVLEQGMVDSL